MRQAILQVADTGPLESLVAMLRYCGYQCVTPGQSLKVELRKIGCSTVLDIDTLVSGGSYDRSTELPEAGPDDMLDPGTIYLDVKAQYNLQKVLTRWSNLKGRVGWYRINGGPPEIVPRCGDEVNLTYPVITPNMWYRDSPSDARYFRYFDGYTIQKTKNWGGMAYVMWPKFCRFDTYDHPRPPKNPEDKFPTVRYQAPVCLVHNAQGWGYGLLFEKVRGLGVRIFGERSPDGLLHHAQVPVVLSNTLCMVHLKSSDAPGYAIYEAMAAGCPVVCSRRLIWRNNMQELLVPGETCLVFDRETHDGLTSEDVVNCSNEISAHLQKLGDVGYNRVIGEAGRKKLREVMWDEKRDGLGFERFMERHFGSVR